MVATGRPTGQGERQLILDRQSHLAPMTEANELQQALSPLGTLLDGEPSMLGGHCSTRRACRPYSRNGGSPVVPNSVAAFLSNTSLLLQLVYE
jgi:hypothetical protein